MLSGLERVFVSLFVISISSLAKLLFVSCAHILTGFFFFLLGFESSTSHYLPVHPQDKMGNGKTWQNSPIKRTHRLLLYLSKGTFGLPRWLSGKEPAWQYRNCSRRGFNTWVKKMPWRRKDYPHPCLENLMDRGAWQATVHGVAKSQTWLSDFTLHIS